MSVLTITNSIFKIKNPNFLLAKVFNFNMGNDADWKSEMSLEISLTSDSTKSLISHS